MVGTMVYKCNVFFRVIIIIIIIVIVIIIIFIIIIIGRNWTFAAQLCIFME